MNHSLNLSIEFLNVYFENIPQFFFEYKTFKNLHNMLDELPLWKIEEGVFQLTGNLDSNV